MDVKSFADALGRAYKGHQSTAEEHTAMAAMALASREVSNALDKLIQGRTLELTESESKHIRSMIARYGGRIPGP